MLDEDAILACVDLIGRTGATNLEFGHLHDDVPVEEACWYAQAQYKGARIIEENHRGPTEAAEALARHVMKGARCNCGKLVALSDSGAFAFTESTLLDGTEWNAEQAAAAGQCRWRRVGPRWEPACGQKPNPAAPRRQPNKKPRRNRKRTKRK
jgi:hypothetical protein